MTDQEFLDHAEHLLTQLELACDHLNDHTSLDIDNQRVGSMITLTLANKSQIVVNLQKPLHEVWLATRSGGYHFKFQNASWNQKNYEHVKKLKSILLILVEQKE